MLRSLCIGGAAARGESGYRLAVSLACGLLLWGGVLHYALEGACAL
jgi:hypothetical protein